MRFSVSFDILAGANILQVRRTPKTALDIAKDAHQSQKMRKRGMLERYGMLETGHAVVDTHGESPWRTWQKRSKPWW